MMEGTNPEIPNKVIDLIEGCGHGFHSQVARWFSDDGWHIVVSPYYMDQALNKAREIDLIAERPFSLYGDSDKRSSNYLVVRLFIECKFIVDYTAFWFADKDIGAARKLVCRNTPFDERNSYTDDHHYLRNNPAVAKLFHSTTKKKENVKLRSSENDPFYRALNQVLSAMTSMYRYPIADRKNVEKFGSPTTIINFPVVVCSSFKDFYAVDFYKDSNPIKLKENFQLEVRYAYADEQQKYQNEYFLIDFVEFNELSDFSAAIKNDAELARIFLSSYF